MVTLIDTIVKDYDRFGNVFIPKGTRITNQTACGVDKNYHFVAEKDFLIEKYGKHHSIIHHAEYHGIDIHPMYVKGVDLFEHTHRLPKKVQALISLADEVSVDNFLFRMETLGYTFDYDFGNVSTNLRFIFDRVRLIVINEHTLACVDPRTPNQAGILIASGLKRSPWKNGDVVSVLFTEYRLDILSVI